MAETQVTIVESGLTRELASAYKVEPSELIRTVKAMCFDGGAASDAQLMVFLTISKQLDLSPFNRELYAFVKGGKMQTIVGYDGWVKLCNRHPQFAGFSFHDHLDDGKVVAVTCKMYRKDWAHPGEATEYMAECAGATDPWKKWPRRMLRIKAYIQCARLTFGFAGIVDPDESVRIETPENWTNGATHEDAVIVNTETGEVMGADGSAIEGEPNLEAAELKQTDELHDKGQATAQQPEPAPEPAKKGRPKSAKSRLKELSKDVAPNRLIVLCGQMGVSKIDEMTEEQAAEAVARLERRK